jgi:hypothetical protein
MERKLWDSCRGTAYATGNPDQPYSHNQTLKPKKERRILKRQARKARIKELKANESP